MLRSSPRMTRGCLTVSRVLKSGRKDYNIQYCRKRMHFARHVAAEELKTYERTTECYRTFMKLVQRYVDENTKRTIREIKKETKRVRKEARDAR